MLLLTKIVNYLDDSLRKTCVRPLGERIHNSRLRKRLHNDNFTLLSSNCIAGTMYRKLGKEFLTPTINLWMTQGDFIKFAVNLREYIAMQLVFQQTDKTYPVVMLGDIQINFLHYKSEAEAEATGERRKRRIDYDNLSIF